MAESRKIPKSHSSNSHSRSPSRENKRKKSTSSSGNSFKNSSSRLPPLPKPPSHYGSSYSWDVAQGQAFLNRVTQQVESGSPLQRADSSSTQSKDSPYLALVQLFNQFQGTPVGPIDTKKALVTVTVLGSTGPLRMLVTSDAKVKDVILMTLLKYAHEGRIPTLGRNVAEFDLYDSQFSSQALDHEDPIAGAGTRNFVLCPRKNLKSPNSSNSTTTSSCASESKASAASNKSWWSYVTGIKSPV